MMYPGCMVVSGSILDGYQIILTSLLVMGISTFTSKEFVFFAGYLADWQWYGVHVQGCTSHLVILTGHTMLRTNSSGLDLPILPRGHLRPKFFWQKKWVCLKARALPQKWPKTWENMGKWWYSTGIGVTPFSNPNHTNHVDFEAFLGWSPNKNHWQQEAISASHCWCGTWRWLWGRLKMGYTRWCPQDSVQLVNILTTKIDGFDGRYILVGGFGTCFLFPYLCNVIIPIDELHHFSAGWLNHQPVSTYIYF